MEVFDYNGNPQILNKKIGEGGQGSVYLAKNLPHVAVKIFSEEKLNKERTEIEEKLSLQITDYPDLTKEKKLSWPRILIFDKHKDFIGYAMFKISGHPLTKLAHPKLYEKYFPDLDRIKMVDILLDILKIIKILHQKNVCIGDINSENIICDPTQYTVSFIDTDSYQIIHNNKIYHCPVGRPEMTPPEHHGGDFSEITRNIESDLFSVAILMFQCLMIGRHPYDNIGGGNPVENLLNGRFPYGKGGAAPGMEGAIPKGPWYNIWSHLTYNVKSLFIKTLGDGVRDPSSRASIQEWEEALTKYRHAMEVGYNIKEIKPKYPKQSNEDFSY